MYSLDVNFLKDRPDYLQTDQKQDRPKKQLQMGSVTPIIIGAVVGLLCLGGVGGFWFYLQQENANLTQEKAALDAKLAEAKALQGEVDKINGEIKKVKEETNALATVFNQIKPWSAMLQDIRERTPAGIQIQSVQQTQVAPPATSTPPPSPGASPSPNAPAPIAPPPTINLEIAGTARSFDEVNYFVLNIQKSPFLESDTTQLVSAQVIDNPTKLELPKDKENQSAAKVIYDLPKLVSYKIQTTLNNVPASEILRDLDRKGAVGLVTRIRTIQQIQQNKITKPNTPINTQTKIQTPTGVSTP